MEMGDGGATRPPLLLEMTPMPNENIEVALARIETKLENVTDAVIPLRERVDKVADELEARLRDVENRTARLDERLTLWQTAQAVYSTVAAMIAAYLGMQK